MYYFYIFAYIKDYGGHFTIRLTKITAAQDDVTLTYHSMRGIYFLAVIFAIPLKRDRFLMCLHFNKFTNKSKEDLKLFFEAC